MLTIAAGAALFMLVTGAVGSLVGRVIREGMQ